MTGTKADYNIKTQAGILTGNVKAIQETMTLTADQVETSNGNQQMTATGSVLLAKGSDRLYAPQGGLFQR